MDVAVGISVAVPSALVRAGMMKTLVGMLRCNEFDPTEEVGFISNPFNWAAGREELQYHRGSVSTAFLLMIFVTMIMALVILTVKVCGGNDGERTTATTWAEAVKTLRLPSLPLVIVLLLSEVCVASAISMLFYKYSMAGDIALSLATLFPLFGYMGVYVYQTAVSSRYVTIEEILEEEGSTSKEDNNSDDGNSDGGSTDSVRTSGHLQQPRRRPLISRALHYLLEPTHDVVFLERHPHGNEYDDDDNEAQSRHRKQQQEQQPRSASRWLRHNFYFVAERRWAVYGAVEVVGGTMMNILEGIPLTTTSRTLCVARPACVMVIAIVLLILLIWKVPNAVRLQQWCSIFVMSGMVLTSALATANATSPSQAIELATGYIGAVVMGAAAILGIIEVVVLLLAYLPAIRDVLSLRSRSLQSVLVRSMSRNEEKKRDDDDNNGHHGHHQLQVPMLDVEMEREKPPLLTIIDDSSDQEIAAPTFREGNDSDHLPPPHQQHNMTPDELEEENLINRQILEELEEFERSEQELQKQQNNSSLFPRR